MTTEVTAVALLDLPPLPGDDDVDDSPCVMPASVDPDVGCKCETCTLVRGRETLIAAGFASLVEVVDVIRRVGGFLRTEDQQALFRAERIIEQAKVTP